MSHKPQYVPQQPTPVSMAPMQPRRRSGFGFNPRAFLIAVLVLVILAVMGMIAFQSGGASDPVTHAGTYQRASFGAVLPKGETGCPAKFTITITHTPSGLVQSIEVHQYVVTPEGDLIAELAVNCLEYRGSGQFNTWTIQSK